MNLNLTTAFLIGMIVCATGFYLDSKFILNENKSIDTKYIHTRPCRCLTNQEVVMLHEKYSMFLDSMNYASKKNKQRLTDSARFYNQLLRDIQ